MSCILLHSNVILGHLRPQHYLQEQTDVGRRNEVTFEEKYSSKSHLEVINGQCTRASLKRFQIFAEVPLVPNYIPLGASLII